MVGLSEYLKLFIGIHYCFGGNNPMTGFDCSGLVCEGLRAMDVIRYNEDLTAQGIWNKLLMGHKSFSPTTFEKDDLIFYGKSPTEITHIGVAVSRWQLIEAGGGRSTTKTVAEAKKRNAFVRIRPIRMRKDLVGAIRL